MLIAGTPKGVILTHRNVLAAIGAVWTLLYEYLTPVDTFLAFLPLAHILEYVVECSWIYAGIPIGYGRIKTLTDASVKDCKGDIAEFKPSIMVGVPAVWESIRKGIQGKVETSGSFKKVMFNGALGAKQFGRDWKIPGLQGLTDAVVFNNVKAQTGGRLKIALSGGGSLSSDTQQFINNSVTELIQGEYHFETVGSGRSESAYLRKWYLSRLRSHRNRWNVCGPPSFLVRLWVSRLSCTLHGD